MGKKKTPLILKLRNIGGTLVVFPSASEDIGLNLLSTTTGVAMSHYALLNIPLMSIDRCVEQCAYKIDTLNDPNLAMSMSLLNYLMNFETIIINNEDYNYQDLNTVSEKVFWHWAMHVGILDTSTLSNSSCGNPSIFVETGYDSDPAIADNTVIKCFGSIDAGNSLSTEFGMFNETYITVPTSYGPGPVYLEASSDNNFKLNNNYLISDVTKLEGRTDNYKYYTYTNGQDYPFYDASSNNAYFYQTAPIKDGFLIVKNLSDIQRYSRTRFNNDSILVNSYDDINIDADNYYGVDTLFLFNAILLYYSVYDQDDIIKTAYATNLFGIIFLDGCKLTDTEKNFNIPTLNKRKSNKESFGNSFSFRVNLKTLSVYDNTDAVIQDNTTTSGVSATEFSDAISNMNRAIDIMNSNLLTVKAILDQYAAILSHYDDMSLNIQDLSTCLNAYLKGTRSSFVDTSILYTNVIRPSEKNPDNEIIVSTRAASLDSTGNIVYNPTVTIKDECVNIDNLYNGYIHSDKLFYNLVDTSTIDLNIADPSITDSRITGVKTTLTRLLDPNVAVIKVRKEPLDLTNSIYLDPDSSLFNVDQQGLSMKKWLDASNNINYVEFIPYIIAGLQKLNKIVDPSSLIL